MRKIQFVGSMAALVALAADAADPKKPCYGLLEDRGLADASLERNAPPLLAENECESMKNHELRLRLLEIPQDNEDPISLSVGAKDRSGGTLRLKIPFSF
jgi:hypothetical protein